MSRSLPHLLLRVLTVVLALCATALAPAVGSTPTATAQAADMSRFDPGNIITDAVFYDSLSMGAGAVQAFLDGKGASCVAGAMPCLKSYRQDTVDQPADALCTGYRGARQESAATVIAKVAVSCGISPRVLLVLLQKEQSLVTTSAPTRRQYENATGFACPDTAPCNPAFSGFVSQVYFAARQFERYRVEAPRYRYQAGRVNTILWHPDASCGSSKVYIANQATASLYDYTPYRPNQAALDAGSGTGDRCSSYGNRNFWSRFTDWFGSTQSVGGTAIFAKYTELGGASSLLGTATSTYICGLVRGGCFQHFRGGALYWSPDTGAHLVRGAILGAWGARGWEKGALGYPTSDEVCNLHGGGCYSKFQYGNSRIYWSPATGTHVVQGAIRTAWKALGAHKSVLGYPTSEPVCGLVQGGCFQMFQGGSMYWSKATGGHVVQGAIWTAWAKRGWETGKLGYPTQDPVPTPTGAVQQFQGGTLTFTAATGKVAVS